MVVKKLLIHTLILVSFFFGITPFAQIPTETDSLEKALRVAGDDTSRVNILNRLGSILLYNTSDAKGLTYEQQAIDLGKKAGFIKGVAIAYRNLGFMYVHRGDLTTALAYFDTCISYSRIKGYRRGEAMGHSGGPLPTWEGLQRELPNTGRAWLFTLNWATRMRCKVCHQYGKQLLCDRLLLRCHGPIHGVSPAGRDAGRC